MMSVFISWVGILLLGNCIVSAQTTFKVDLSGETKKVWAFWESCTSYDHAYPALRSDWQQQLKTIHEELGTKFVRFMGIFDDEIGISNPWHSTASYSYYNSDTIYDYILSIGMKPIIELDFVPSNFLSDPQSHLSSSVFSGFPAYKGPPDNNTQWYEFVYSFVTHLVERYGSEEISTWVFDTWDEPNTGKWMNSNITSFEETYSFTAKVLKDINNSFSIGSPGTSHAQWIPEFPVWANQNKIKLDWVSTHLYPTHSYCSNRTHNGFYLCLQHLSDVIKNINKNYGIGITAYGCNDGQGMGDEVGPHDTSNNAAGITTYASQLQQLDNKQFGIMSFTAFTDLWDQPGIDSAPFHNGYGWLTIRGVKKPTFHALKLLHNYATDRDYFVNINKFLNQNITTLELFATINNNKTQLSLFIMNWMLHGYTIKNESVQIDIISKDNQLNKVKYGTLYRIDDKHCNPAVIWKEMDSPIYPTQQQMMKMINASNLYPTQLNVHSSSNDSVTFELDVNAYAMALIVVDI
eukprot:232281_1